MNVQLFTTVGCHLCDDALSLLNRYQRLERLCIEIEKVEISGSDNLVAAYGIRIPVVKKSTGELELGWPFDLEELSRFLEHAQTQ